MMVIFQRQQCFIYTLRYLHFKLSYLVIMNMFDVFFFLFLFYLRGCWGG